MHLQYLVVCYWPVLPVSPAQYLGSQFLLQTSRGIMVAYFVSCDYNLACRSFNAQQLLSVVPELSGSPVKTGPSIPGSQKQPNAPVNQRQNGPEDSPILPAPRQQEQSTPPAQRQPDGQEQTTPPAQRQPDGQEQPTPPLRPQDRPSIGPPEGQIHPVELSAGTPIGPTGPSFG